MAQPRHIGDVLSQLLARRGYARVQSGGACGEMWRQAAGEALASCSRATQVKRGVLEVVVENSLVMQEIGFQKTALVKRMAELLPGEGIRDLRCRVGALS